MILLTGAAGAIGRPLVRQLLEAGEPLRCLVRQPRRMGEDRVRVQIALGDLGDPEAFRNAMRGVDTVVHLAASIRDQPQASVEEVNALASARLVRAAERAGVRRFVLFSCLGASLHSRSRFLRAKALGEEVVRASSLETIVLAPSLVYAPGNRWLTMLERLSLLPVVPVSGSGAARFQPICAEDVAACAARILTGAVPEHAVRERAEGERIELAGPEVLSYDELVRTALRALGRPRPLAHVPLRLVRVLTALAGWSLDPVPATWDEAELMEVSLLADEGTAHAQALGVSPRPVATVLG